MYTLRQMLTPDSKTQVLVKAIAYGDEWFGNESAGKRGDKMAILPGNQAVRTIEQDWDYNFAFQSPIMKRTSFLGVSSTKSCKSS